MYWLPYHSIDSIVVACGQRVCHGLGIGVFVAAVAYQAENSATGSGHDSPDLESGPATNQIRSLSDRIG